MIVDADDVSLRSRLSLMKPTEIPARRNKAARRPATMIVCSRHSVLPSVGLDWLSSTELENRLRAMAKKVTETWRSRF